MPDKPASWHSLYYRSSSLSFFQHIPFLFSQGEAHMHLTSPLVRYLFEQLPVGAHHTYKSLPAHALVNSPEMPTIGVRFRPCSPRPTFL